MRAAKIVNVLLEAKIIAVDLDGTLAKHLSGKFDKDKIGPPVNTMLAKVKRAQASGHTIRIFTARASDAKNIPPIKAWLKDQGLAGLEVTHEKTPDFDEFWDDKAKEVVKNKGTFA